MSGNVVDSETTEGRRPSTLATSLSDFVALLTTYRSRGMASRRRVVCHSQSTRVSVSCRKACSCRAGTAGYVRVADQARQGSSSAERVYDHGRTSQEERSQAPVRAVVDATSRCRNRSSRCRPAGTSDQRISRCESVQAQRFHSCPHGERHGARHRAATPYNLGLRIQIHSRHARYDLSRDKDLGSRTSDKHKNPLTLVLSCSSR